MIFPRSLEWLIEVLKNPNWEIISSSQFENAVIKLQDISKNGSRRSAAKMNRIKSTLRSFFKWAFQSGHISHNPAANLRISKY